MEAILYSNEQGSSTGLYCMQTSWAPQPHFLHPSTVTDVKCGETIRPACNTHQIGAKSTDSKASYACEKGVN